MSLITVDVGPAIIQTVAIEDANGEYSIDLSMTPMGPEGPEGKPGRVVDILGDFGLSKKPAELPADGLIPKDWDAPGQPAKSIQFQIGDGLQYKPADTTDILYGHVFAFTGGEYGANWIDCGPIRGPKGDTGNVGENGDKGETGAAGPGNTLSIGNVSSGDTASAAITGASPNQVLSLVLPKGDKGADGVTPSITMTGDQITVNGAIVGPHLTGPQGPQGEVGKSLTILGHYDTEQELNTAHPTGKEGDCYLVGQGYLYVWDGSKWANVGQLQGPKGDVGAKGDAGPANTLTIGKVESGPLPSVVISGTSPNQVLDFVLAKGDKGDQGIQGSKGDQGIQGVAGGKGDTGSKGDKGDTGSPGPANSLKVGSVKTGPVAVEIVGQSPDQTINFTIPDASAGGFIIGEVRMFKAGTVLPSGWHVCDGQNDTVDLRDKFVVASGSKFTAGSTGGSFTIGANQMPSHTHSGTTGNESAGHTHNLSVSVSVSGTTANNNVGHTHTFSGSASGTTSSGGSHSHGISDPGHTHLYTRIDQNPNYKVDGNTGPAGYCSPVNGGTTGSGTGIGIAAGGDHTHSLSGVQLSGTTAANSANHTHTFSGSGSGSGTSGAASSDHTHAFTTGASGSGQEYMQPYYALIFAMFTGA